MNVKTEEEKSAQKCYTKAQILEAEKYAGYQDLLGVLIQENEKCTLEETDNRINSFRKGKVK